MKYDAETKNGIPYVKSLYWTKFEYRTIVDDLDDLYPTKHAILTEGTTKSYTVGSRSLSRQTMSAKEVIALWDKLLAEKTLMEQGRSKRTAVGVVMRDW